MNKNADVLSRNPPQESSKETSTIEIVDVTEEEREGKPSIARLNATALKLFPIRNKGVSVQMANIDVSDGNTRTLNQKISTSAPAFAYSTLSSFLPKEDSI